MNKIWILMVVAIMALGCSNQSGQNKESQTDSLGNALKVAKFLEKAGNFINSSNTPVIEIDEAFQNLNNYLFVDIRKKDEYLAGHIPGSKQIEMKDLLNYFQNQENTGKYKKVILVCANGQSATYSATLLRLVGYSNIYALKRGIAAWNKQFAAEWSTNVSNKFAANLEKKQNPKGEKSHLPDIQTKKKYAIEIIEERVSHALKEGFRPSTITIDSLLANKESFYIVNVWDTAKYNQGHFPGAIQYTPKKSFKLSEDLLTLPTNKVIVVYCFIGHSSAAATAFLKVLGYNAKSLRFGANSFMNDFMVKNEKIGNGFNAANDCRDYPITKGEEKEVTTNQAVSPSVIQPITGTAKNSAKPVKKKSGGGGGC
jgi:rhodanese-related sulfurtransferase